MVAQVVEPMEARATHLRFLAGEVDGGTHRAQAAAYLRLAGRRLSMLVGFRWTAEPDCLNLEHFYHALLGAMITVASTCRHVARAANVAEPGDPLAWEGWLQPGEGLLVKDVVNVSGLGRYDPRTLYDPPTGHFPEARAAGSDIEDLDELARDWLTYWLLDMAACGFEDRVAGWDRPDFLRMPDLASPLPTRR